ncbi:MAG: TrkA C-terminal domain-containing protein [Rikenellaceae bacterium]
MLESLFSSPFFALFVIIALGFMLGKVNVKGVSLDVSAVIFIALLFGHYGVVIPSALSDFGMVLFIFTIGMQAGPGFFDSFRSKGKVLVILAVVIVFSASFTAAILQTIFGFSAADTAGLLTGALTSTPGLATARELTGDQTAVAYGIAYPFGVIGVILFVKLLPRVLKIDMKAVEKEAEEAVFDRFPKVLSKTFRVENNNIFGSTLAQLRVREMTGAVVSRIKHGEVSDLPTANTALYEGDLVRAVGTEEALGKIQMLIGEKVEENLPITSSMERLSGLVTNKRIVNMSLATLNLQQNFNCTVTRVRRSGVDITPTPDLDLKYGDKLTLIAPRENIIDVLRMLGNDKKQLSDTDFFPIALGIVLGVLFGKISLNFGTGFTFSFGLTGGILVISLLLSAKGKTGNIIWSMSASATQLLRQLGLLLFLAGVGTSAGTTVVESFMNNGLTMFVSGMLITLIPMIVAILVSKYLLKVNILDLLGVITGGMTSTPGLAAADSMTSSSAPSIAYATVYPVAMVFLIICVQIITMLS